jgi:tRNA threonylcarbamoyladenosine biosynthesis protein TsaB
MTILGFDTATPATTVALWDPSRGLTLEDRDDPPPGERPRHTGRLLALIVEVLERADTDWDELSRIAVGTGPGTFTGLRIGIATARALGQARAIPLVGISTLESLAAGAAAAAQAALSEGVAGAGASAARVAAAAGADTVLGVLDARRGEAFVAGWRTEQLVRPAGSQSETGAGAIVPPAALTPEALVETVRGLGGNTLAVGDGAIKFRAVLEPSGATVPVDGSPLHKVTATTHCRLAADRPVSPPEQIHPDYLRLPDAELTRRAKP